MAFHVFTALYKSWWWSTPAAYLLIVVTLPGIYAAVISLLGLIGHKKKHSATLLKVENKESATLEITLKMEKPFHYSPGQFAFLTFPHSAESHPFTIAPYDAKGQELRFAIKALGDYTSQLAKSLRPGESVVVEGPWGRFDFNAHSSRQIWMAGGIGITPFIAQPEYRLHSNEKHGPVDLWYCVSDSNDVYFAQELAYLCRNTGVTLHQRFADKGERLTASQLMASQEPSDQVHVWFCGPGAFASALYKGLQKFGITRRKFHYDHFSMR